MSGLAPVKKHTEQEGTPKHQRKAEVETGYSFFLPKKKKNITKDCGKTPEVRRESWYLFFFMVSEGFNPTDTYVLDL